MQIGMNKTMIKYTAFYLFQVCVKGHYRTRLCIALGLCFKDEVNNKHSLWESFPKKLNYSIVVNGLFVVNVHH